MKCRNCGAYLPDGALRCKSCGMEIRIVPDYNPLDDVLTAQVKGSIDGSAKPLDHIDEYTTGKIHTDRKTSSNRQTAQRKRVEPSGERKQLTPEQQRRRQAARRKAMKKKRRQRALLLMGFAAIFLLLVGVIGYQFSYKAQVNKGYKALNHNEYEKAETYFNKAITKKPKRGEAYHGMSDLYLAQGSADKAEDLLLAAIDQYPMSSEIYEATFAFYISTKNEDEIPILLDDADPSVTKALEEYKVSAPKFSLDNKKEYDDVQQLSLEASEKTIYYTLDGTDPFDSDSKIKYEEPVQISEGETMVKAIAVNEKGIPSLTISKTYTVELPIEDAPAVSPSTGQYDYYNEITITVPDGYTAYYTTDGSDPDEYSELYTGPIDMPYGTTIFKAVLKNGKGRLSSVTTRNYEMTVE